MMLNSAPYGELSVARFLWKSNSLLLGWKGRDYNALRGGWGGLDNEAGTVGCKGTPRMPRDSRVEGGGEE